MIDLSDGLGVDAAHLCRASKVAARVQADQLPIAPGALDAAREAGADPWEVVAGGGEDFALLAAVPAEDAAGAARRGGEAAGVPAEVVGELVEAHQQAARVTLATDDGACRDITDLGHQHGGDT
jgi:thiamine-monophosphate kinase